MNRRSTSPLVPLLVPALVLVTSCGLFDDPRPERAHLIVLGDDEVQLVVSTVFVAGASESGGVRVELIEADTFLIVPPFDSVYSIRQERRFFAEASRIEGTDPPEVRMQVFLDGQPRYDQLRVLENVFLRFVYSVNQFFLDDDVVF